MKALLLILLSALAANAQQFIEGKVLQVVKDGILVDVTPPYYGVGQVPDTKIVFVANHPSQKTLADGQRVSVQASSAGRYQYTAVSGATKTVERYDATTPPEQAKQQEEAFNREMAWMEYEQKLKAKAAAAEAERVKEMKKRAIIYQHQQASNGYPSFQLELGKRYLRGDGVETNIALARHWLTAACTNGEVQATNLLKQLDAIR
jgi:TPR repeat protein